MVTWAGGFLLRTKKTYSMRWVGILCKVLVTWAHLSDLYRVLD